MGVVELEQLLDLPRGLNDLHGVETRVDAALVEHVHEIFGCDVAVWRHAVGHANAAADAADRALEIGRARLRSCQRGRERHPIRVVQVKAKHQLGPTVLDPGREVVRGARVVKADRDCEVEGLDAERLEALDDADDPLRRGVALVGAEHRATDRDDHRRGLALH